MALATGRSFPLQPCSLFKNASINKSPPGGTSSWVRHAGAEITKPCRRTYIAAQQRPTWLPGPDPPTYLDGTLAGDFGFDPLGLGEDPASLRWYVQAELVHARFAMIGVSGILLTYTLRFAGLETIPIWYVAGAQKYFAGAKTLLIHYPTIFYGLFPCAALWKQKGTWISLVQDLKLKRDPSFGLEAAFEGLEPGYPGGPLFNPLAIAKDIKGAHEWKLKKIKNGRLSMVAMLGIFMQASVTHVGPIDNLVEHVSDPWHKTIVQIIGSL